MVVSRIPRIILEGDEESSSYLAREGIRQLGILKELMSFGDLQQDVRRVEYIDGSRIVCKSCFGEDTVHIYTEKEEEERGEERLYIYVTISNYVTIWDLETGEVAEDICDNDNSLITFPCHKDKLVTWLKRIEDRPTRQVLKDNPENNRDFLEDNEQDAGDEDRVKSTSLEGFGLPQTVDYTHLVKNNVFECSTCPDSSVVVRDEIIHDGIYIPNAVSIQTHWPISCETSTLGTCWPVCKTCKKWNVDCKCFWDKTTEKDRPGGSLSFENSWWKTYLGHWYHDTRSECCYDDFLPYWCNFGRFDISLNVYHGFVAHDNNAKFLERWRWRCKYLILGSYNKAGWTASETDRMACALTQIKFETTHRDSQFGYHGFHRRYESRAHSYVLSYKTVLGDLVLDFIPIRKLKEKFADLNDYQQLNITLRDSSVNTWVPDEFKSEEDYLSNTFTENPIDIHIAANGLSSKIGDYLKNSFPLGDPEDMYYFYTGSAELPRASIKRAIYVGSGPNIGGYTQHAIKANKSMGEVDVDDRFAVSWCECPDKDNWYKVRLFFYMGRVKYGKLTQQYCPANLKHMHQADWCNNGEYSESYVGKRFSSVQAAIELERPGNYKKEKISIPGKPGWIKRYERPEDYSGLCAYPDRECGYPEDEENNICCPFDGTYDIYTLGEAVEELINTHYVDESNDQLLVYLYKCRI